MRFVDLLSEFLRVLSPFFTVFLISFVGLDVVVHDFLWVVVVDISPLSVGSRWSSIDFLRFLVFHGSLVFSSNSVSFSEVLSGFVFEFVLSMDDSSVVGSNSFDDFSVEFKSVSEVGGDVFLHSSFSGSSVSRDSG